MNIVTPDTVNKFKKIKDIPQYVLDAFNELIAENYSGPNTMTYVYQNDVVALICKNNPDVTNKFIYENKLLDIEDLYGSYGWEVSYYKQPFYSSDSSYFRFSKKN